MKDVLSYLLKENIIYHINFGWRLIRDGRILINGKRIRFNKFLSDEDFETMEFLEHKKYLKL